MYDYPSIVRLIKTNPYFGCKGTAILTFPKGEKHLTFGHIQHKELKIWILYQNKVKITLSHLGK